MPAQLTSLLRDKTEDRFQNDWQRQRRTAADILERFKRQEGVILADQVGMGKTYVALAVAVSVIMRHEGRAQVVIFVPAAVADKWVREWRKFSESLLEAGHGIRCVEEPLRSGEEFLKKLDDPDKPDHILVLTHTALTSMLKDSFVQLALLYYATRRRKDVNGIRRRIAKWSAGLKGVVPDRRFTTERVAALLDKAPGKWKAVWEELTGEALPDDPVPATLETAVQRLDLQELFDVLSSLPINSSHDIERRLARTRKAVAAVTQKTWKWMLAVTNLDLPLLIVDEAHRLKNGSTRISSLFGKRNDDTEAGAFREVFRRMLFLTATPFELGHSELIEVIRRMGAVRALDPLPQCTLEARLKNLHDLLTAAQSNAIAFDAAWSRIQPEQLSAFNQWDTEKSAPEGVSNAVREAWELARIAVQTRLRMHVALRPWVIRHERPRRREYHPGDAITSSTGEASGGLQVPEAALLPFLLAARAQSIALDEKGDRPLYAYGIASSFETFRRLGSDNRSAVIDSDLERADRQEEAADSAKTRSPSDSVRWYQRSIEHALAASGSLDAHPKICATVDKAVELWLAGEKCLIFCWFIRTGEVVERTLKGRIEDVVRQSARDALFRENPQLQAEDVFRALDRISARLLDRDTPSYAKLRHLLSEAVCQAACGLEEVITLIVDAGIRHLRTREYLVRYMPLDRDLTVDQVWAGLRGENRSGIALLDRWCQFAERLANAHKQISRTSSRDEPDSEFSRIKTALLGASADGEESEGRGGSLESVRRAHGGTDRTTRERLIAQFNTPFAPDLLVASSVMGEGIDLHQECRFVIHHDLDWNPSVLEQRTGRLDQVGALAEREDKSIEVYEPYLAGTYDEKMYRVVKDRAQWFDIVMGRIATGRMSESPMRRRAGCRFMKRFALRLQWICEVEVTSNVEFDVMQIGW
ncbi:MAG: helicase-related protein [Burkholderiaceae bacterium]